MVRDPRSARESRGDTSDTTGKRRRSLADIVRSKPKPSDIGQGKPGTGRPDEEENYRRPKQGPK